MKIQPKNVKKFQVGGQMPTEVPAEETTTAPAEQPVEQEPQGEDPIAMLAQMAAQSLQSGDCNMMAQVCQGFLQLVQQMSGGAPEETQGEPVFRKGGTLVRRIKK